MTTKVMTMADLAIQLFGEEYENEPKFQQFIHAIGLWKAPKLLVSYIMELEIDMHSAYGCLAYKCEQLLQVEVFRHTNESIYFGSFGSVETPNEIAALMMIHDSILYISWGRFSCPTNFSGQSVKRKDAFEIAKLALANKLNIIYSAHPDIEFTKLMGLEAMKQYA
ncbi:hypothetical protein [Aeromonas hydrophila]|uniref:hypothetical protein n=1 Tax=Aeromonas TaxID=642 RepID=UPI003670677D